MKNKWYIYKITNLLNGKNYIGKRRHQDSDTPLQERYMGSGRLIKQAIKKYGLQNFKKEILDDLIETNQDAALKEVVWIAFYKEIGGANYNLCYGINIHRRHTDTALYNYVSFLDIYCRNTLFYSQARSSGKYLSISIIVPSSVFSSNDFINLNKSEFGTS